MIIENSYEHKFELFFFNEKLTILALLILVWTVPHAQPLALSTSAHARPATQATTARSTTNALTVRVRTAQPANKQALHTFATAGPATWAPIARLVLKKQKSEKAIIFSLTLFFQNSTSSGSMLRQPVPKRGNVPSDWNNLFLRLPRRLFRHFLSNRYTLNNRWNSLLINLL